MILIGLGANLDSDYGTTEDTLAHCVTQFSDKNINVIRCSHIWASAPVPVSDQPWYKNAVCLVETTLSSHDLLATLNELEDVYGRVRHQRNDARVLDLDLLAFNDEVVDRENLILPHPRMHVRAFVLYPLQELAPNWVHPVSKCSLDQMIDAMPEGQEIKRLDRSI